MSRSQPAAATVFSFLKGNLGPKCLGALTGTDTDALMAAVQIANLWARGRSEHIATAFRYVVLQMQADTRELAFHAIAHPTDWSYRYMLWQQAQLPMFERVRVCKYGPQPRPVVLLNPPKPALMP